jgi:hypothetical protein
MSKESDRLKALARKVSEKHKDVDPKNEFPGNVFPTDVNPRHGEKGGFIKVTATLSPETYRMAMAEVTRRKLAKSGDAQISAVIREALAAYLGREKERQASA